MGSIIFVIRAFYVRLLKISLQIMMTLDHPQLWLNSRQLMTVLIRCSNIKLCNYEAITPLPLGRIKPIIPRAGV